MKVAIFNAIKGLEEWKNPKEGRSLGEKPDMDALPRYPYNFPVSADREVINSIFGKTENEKTYSQQERKELEEKQGKE